MLLCKKIKKSFKKEFHCLIGHVLSEIARKKIKSSKIVQDVYIFAICSPFLKLFLNCTPFNNHSMSPQYACVTRQILVTTFFHNIQKQPTEMFYKKAVLKNLEIFTGTQLCWVLFLIMQLY